MKKLKNYRIVRRHLGLATITAGLAVGTAGVLVEFAQAHPSKSPAKKLEQFISHPPPYLEVVFDHYPLNTVDVIRKHKEPVATRYLSRWQTNAFTLQEIATSPNKSAPRGRMINGCGYYGENYWAYSSFDGLHLFHRSPNNTQAQNERNGPFLMVVTRMERLRTLLNAGVGGCRIGSIRWHAHHFATSGIQYPRHPESRSYSGLLRLDETGTAVGLDFELREKGKIYHWEAAYAYGANDVPSFFPSSIRLSVVTGPAQTFPMEAFELVKMQTGKGLRDRSLFMPQGAALSNTNIAVSSNGVQYAFGPHGLKPIPEGPPASFVHEAQKHRLLRLGVFTILTSAVIWLSAGLILRHRRRGR